MTGINLLTVFVPAAAAFWIGIAVTPLVTHYLYRWRVWKKSPGKTALDGAPAVEFGKLRDATETKTPRMGGIVIWSSVTLTIGAIWLVGQLFPGEFAAKLNFFSRSQTWIPFTALIVGALVGLVNDILDVVSIKGERGIPLRIRIIFVTALSAAIGWWFYDKLDVVSVALPFGGGELALGWLIVPFFVFVSLCLYASGIIDGIDGLSGGVFASIFAAYSFIAFNQEQIDLAAFCATVVGALLAFLWFNVPPARFWMTETGSMGLTLTIAVVAFMTDTLGEGKGVSALPVIAFLLVATVASTVLQVLSKRLYGKKLFRIAPLHHHFEAIGWPGHKVTMRYWILSIIFAIVGVSLALLG